MFIFIFNKYLLYWEMAESRKGYCDMRGWLLMWTNYLKGYQPRWFVLSDGALSYYRNEAEMARTCRGSVNLIGALIHSHDPVTFIISKGNDQVFYLKAANEVERQHWVTALELAKMKAIGAQELSEQMGVTNETSDQQRTLLNIIDSLGGRIESLQICNDLIVKHGDTLKKMICEFEKVDSPDEFLKKLKNINQEATLFRMTSSAMINACLEYMEIAKFKFNKLLEMITYEKHQRGRLEKIIQGLMIQYLLLEKSINNGQILTKSDLESTPEVEKSLVCLEDESVNLCNEISSHKEVNCVDISESKCFTVTVPVIHSNNCTENKKNDEFIRFPDEALIKVEDLGNQKTDFVTNLANTCDKNSVLNCNPLINEINDDNAGGSSGAFGTQSAINPQQTSISAGPKRRTRIPDKPNQPLNLWSFLKNCIGKELSKIPMPVNFCEPLSMLQRLTEEYEYSDVLDHAASCEDLCEQLAYVAAFSISNYSSTANRTGKPFNPLLGETYECDRTDDLGWKLLAEQVSHHPPIAAVHCEGKEWICWEEFSISSKFRGKYLQVIPLGITHVLFRKSGRHLTWRKVMTTINNIIVGKIWIDQSGEVDVINHTDGSSCHLSFFPYSYFNADNQRRVKGYVMDNKGIVKWVLNGTWDKLVDIAPVLSISGTKDNPIYKTGDYIQAWRIKDPPPNNEQFYCFSLFACQLNEIEEGVAPTDSRNRPDQRLMEEGKWDEAKVVKAALENKQRLKRKEREKAQKISAASSAAVVPDGVKNKKKNEVGAPDVANSNNQGNLSSDKEFHGGYEPIWFKKELDPITGTIIYVYKGGYWEAKKKQDWSRCPDLY